MQTALFLIFFFIFKHSMQRKENSTLYVQAQPEWFFPTHVQFWLYAFIQERNGMRPLYISINRLLCSSAPSVFPLKKMGGSKP